MIQTCKVKDRCGACNTIGTEYKDTLVAKKKFVQDLYPKYQVDDCLGMENPYNYRHKVYASFASDKKGMVYAGMYAQYSHKVVSSKNCRIQSTIANRIIETMCKLATKMKIEAYNEDRGWGSLRHAYIRVSSKTNKVLLTIVIGSRELPGSKKFVKGILDAHPEIETVLLNWNDKKTSMILGDKEKVLFGKGYIMDEIDGMQFRIGSKSFYQVNPVQTELLYKTAIDLAKIQKEEEVFDACCGIGTISLLTARLAKEVVGVEINADAIRDAKMNAKLNGIENIQFFADDATNFITRLIDAPNVVFLDPPRSGMSQDFMNALKNQGASRIVYISCNPVTQARDIKNLTCAGYVVERIVPVDLFPFTDHVESIVLLVKNGTPNLNLDYKPSKNTKKQSHSKPVQKAKETNKKYPSKSAKRNNHAKRNPKEQKRVSSNSYKNKQHRANKAK